MSLYLGDTSDQLAPLEEAVAMQILSRLAGVESARNYCNMLNRLFAAAGRVPAGPGRDGGWPTADSALSASALTHEELSSEWRRAQRAARPLPNRIVESFFPKVVWAVVADLVEMGPTAALELLENVVEDWANGYDPASDAKRPPINDETATHYLNAVRRFAREVCELRKKTDPRGSDSNLLEEWVPENVPKLRSPSELGASARRRDRGAPPYRAIRQALRQLDREARARLEGGTAWQRRTAWRFVRDRAIVALLVTLGVRAQNLRLLRVGDYEPNHHFPDGSVGPALLFRHFKGKRGVVAAKGLPPHVGEWIEDWLAIHGRRDDPDAWLWIGRDEMFRLDQPLSEPGPRIIDHAVAVTVGASTKNGKRYSPHTLRHLAAKLAYAVGSEWLYEHRSELLSDELHGLPSNAQTFADILLDHKLHDITDRYKDINTSQGREHWSRVITHGVWDYVWGDKGARRGPDLPRVDAARRSLRDAERTERALEEQLETVDRDQRQLGQEVVARGDAMTTHEVALATLRMGVIQTESSRLARELAAAAAKTERARFELDAALSARVPVADEVTDETLREWESRLAEIRVEPEQGDVGETLVVLRDAILAREFRWAVGEDVLPEQTLAHYLNGRHMSRGGRRLFMENPEGGMPAGVRRASSRRFEIVIDDLPLARYPQYVIDRLRWLQTQPWPRRGEAVAQTAPVTGAR